MRRIPEQVLTEYRHKIVNIHPALLPSFGGQGMYGSNVHQAVFDYGVKVSGCTVHFIDSGYDTGPIILQQVVSIDDAKSPDEVGAKVLEAERIAYPEAVRLLCTGRVRVDGRRVEIEKAEEE
jgi:phosphoribosylglycinamide formyltransferase-1